MIAIILGLMGLFIGSFLNVVIDRLPRHETIIKGRSHCDICGHVLTWYDLVPLISFLSLLGKCRYCHKFIGWKYPLVEITTAVLFALTAISISVTSLVTLLLLLLSISCLIVIFYTDLWYGIIPNEIILVGTLGAMLLAIVEGRILPSLLSGIGALLFFLLLFLITKQRGIGFGDVKLVFFLGILVGFPFIITSMYVAFLTGAAIAFILIIGRRKHFKRDTIAFGPFLVFGALLQLFWGNILWSFFVHTLLHL